ncbi:MAG TPA: aldo/keto reductase [Cellvibrionaceae bacterium]
MKPQRIIYGTAWKKERTTDLVLAAWQAGFRAFDTACQPKHYREDLVGEALIKIMQTGAKRSDLYLQTKFTPISGQDAASIPYNPALPVAQQIAQSFAISQKNLNTAYLNALILHSPLASVEATLDAWRAMEIIFNQGGTQQLGISNCYDVDFFKQLYARSNVKPTILQNRFYAKTGYDAALRAFCVEQDVCYQSFWSLTANPHILEQAFITLLYRRLCKTPAQIFLRYLTARDITPLTGTCDVQHMQEDLSIFDFELSADELASIDHLLVAL